MSRLRRGGRAAGRSRPSHTDPIPHARRGDPARQPGGNRRAHTRVRPYEVGKNSGNGRIIRKSARAGGVLRPTVENDPCAAARPPPDFPSIVILSGAKDLSRRDSASPKKGNFGVLYKKSPLPRCVVPIFRFLTKKTSFQISDVLLYIQRGTGVRTSRTFAADERSWHN